MRRTMSAAEFCRFANLEELRTFSYDSCNQPGWDCAVSFSLVFHSVRADGSVGLLSFRSDDAKMRIQNVQSVTYESDGSVLGPVVTVSAESPIDSRSCRYVFVVS